ncbi:hypothetical protein ACQJBY_043626 [Aegilops geniculata]
MGVKGLTLFHLKSHLQKYRMGKQTGKETPEQSKDVWTRFIVCCKEPLSANFLKGSYLLDAQGGMSLSPRVSTQDAKESQEVKEALRAQMEMQRSLHEQVEVQKHVDIRMDAYTTYINTLLEKACKIVSEQFASSGFSVSDQSLPELSSGGIMCGTATDALSSSVFHQLSVSSINMHSPGGKPSPSGMEGQLLLQRSPEFKRKSSC